MRDRPLRVTKRRNVALYRRYLTIFPFLRSDRRVIFARFGSDGKIVKVMRKIDRRGMRQLKPLGPGQSERIWLAR